MIQKSQDWKDTAVVVAYDDSDGWYDHRAAKITNGSSNAAVDTAMCGGVAASGRLHRPLRTRPAAAAAGDLALREGELRRPPPDRAGLDPSVHRGQLEGRPDRRLLLRHPGGLAQAPVQLQAAAHHPAAAEVERRGQEGEGGVHPLVPPLRRRVLVDRRGWILLQERDEFPAIDPEKWGLVGGHVDDGEDVEAAAYRELLEETGVRLSPGTLQPWRTIQVFHAAYGSDDRMHVYAAPIDAHRRGHRLRRRAADRVRGAGGRPRPGPDGVRLDRGPGVPRLAPLRQHDA